jgi:predicted ATPase/class 3 adenylate cyclase
MAPRGANVTVPSGTVTFLFTDVEGSTRLWAADREAMSASLALHDAILRGTIERGGGYVFSTGGDSFSAAFARASDAVAAAQRAQAELAAAPWPGPALRVRMGLHLGEAEERGGDYFGPVVNTAARVEAAGHGGQVLLTEPVRSTADIAALDLGVHALRDVDAPLHLYQLGDLQFPPLRVPRDAAPLRCEVLGVISAGGTVLSSGRQRRLLAALAMAHRDGVSSDRLVDVVWDGHPPPSPLNALQTYVSRLRTSLGGDAIVHRPPGYALTLSDDAVDAWRFEALVDRARALPPAETLDLLDEALGLWRGVTAYAELADSDFARGDAVRLGELRALAEGMRLDALLRLGRHDEVLTDSLRLIERDPYREEPWEQRMRALHAVGRNVDAVRAFHDYRERLLDDVGLEPSADLTALERALVAAPAAAAAPSSPAELALPSPLTSFIGRDDSVREVEILLEAQWLVTLIGPGGAGKTRLAIEAARAHHDRRGEPTWFVELVTHGPDDVARAAAHVLGVGDDADLRAALRRHLAAGPSLLVLDNCEHVVEAVAALVDGVLPFCPGLRILATSRVPLAVAGEATWTVPPLDTDAATRLFVDRAAAAGIRIDDHGTVAAICAAVDGLPLGVELAAAASRGLPLNRVADGLRAQRGAISTTPAGRHRSLDAAVAWSHQLLAPAEQVLLRRLAVFEGGWTVDAAEAVCVGGGLDEPVLPSALIGLEAASLVSFDPAAGRYSMLETIRGFARARLADSGEVEPRRGTHLGWCLQVAAGAAPKLRGPAAADEVRRLDIEYPNLRAALRWALADDSRLAQATALAHDLCEFWLVTDAGYEAVGFLRQVVAQDASPTVERVELGVQLSRLLSVIGDFAAYAREAEAALALARRSGDRRLVAGCLANAAFGGPIDSRSDWAAEALAIAEEIDDEQLAADALHMLGLLALRAGRNDDAITYLERALQASETSIVLGTHGILGTVYRNVGRWSDARREMILRERQEADAGARPTEACMELALIELCLGDPEAAGRAVDRGTVWGRPADDYPGAQMLFDAVAALLEVGHGDLTEASDVAARLAAAPSDVSGQGTACLAWFVAGEILGRADRSALARRCFANILRHRTGAVPYYRAHALAGFAGALDDESVAADLGAVAAAIRAKHGLVTPPWLTVGRFESGETTITEDDAIAAALDMSPP